MAVAMIAVRGEDGLATVVALEVILACVAVALRFIAQEPLQTVAFFVTCKIANSPSRAPRPVLAVESLIVKVKSAHRRHPVVQALDRRTPGSDKQCRHQGVNHARYSCPNHGAPKL